jgi:predicted ABC-type ATPase
LSAAPVSAKPFLLVFAGPNGSGKSTLKDYLAGAGIEFGTYINPDEIALTLDLPEPTRTAQAQQRADFHRESCLLKRTSLSFETVMSHPSKVEFMVRARDAGYDVSLFFVGTSDPEINVRRVENRVASGGHPVPEDRIRKRYWRSLSLLPGAALVARRTVVFDNSALAIDPVQVGFRVASKRGLRPVAELTAQGSKLQMALEADVPQWVFDSLVAPLDRIVRESGGRLSLSIRQADACLG